MRVGMVRAPSGESWLARVDGEVAVPVRACRAERGADPLRDALAAGVDLQRAHAVAAEVPLEACELLAPVTAPQKIIAIGLNYADHAREAGLTLPTAPIGFIKTPNSIVGPGDEIRFTSDTTTQLDFEAELAVVIGRRVRNTPVEDALSAVFGYTVCNDVSARDAQFADAQWFRGKSFDTFCPLGPWIVTADEVGDPQRLRVACRVNGTTLQDSSTEEMVFGVAELVSYFSRFMTLEPGDVISTGTPNGVGFARTPPIFLQDGDVVEAEVERVGVLRNTVVQEQRAPVRWQAVKVAT